MTQRNSSCKLTTLIRKCCGRNAALFTVSLLMQLIAMPVLLIMNIEASMRYMDMTLPHERQSVLDMVQDNLLYSGAETFVLICLGILCGIAMFRYLHVKQQTDFFHALPITRGRLFASHVLTGLLAVVPAYLISLFLSCMVCSVYGFADAIQPALLVLSACMSLAGFLLVYVVSILAAIISGHTLVSLLVCGWFQFGLLAAYEAVNQLIYILYPARAYDMNGTSGPLLLSPVFEAASMMRPLADRGWETAAYYKACLPSLLYCVIVGALVLALAYKLNQVRKSEHTGMSIAFPRIELPFKLFMVAVCAIGCGLIFQATVTSWTALFLAMAIGGLIASCIVEIVYDQTFRSLFRRWKSLAVFYAVCAVVLACMAMDITGWNSSLPERDQVVEAQLVAEDGHWSCAPADMVSYDYYGSDVFYAVSRDIYADSRVSEDEAGSRSDYLDSWSDTTFQTAEALDAIYDSAVLGAEAMKGDRAAIKDGMYHSGYTVTFTLAGGKTFRRQYFLPRENETIAENGARVRFSEEYLERMTSAAQAHANKEKAAVLSVQNYSDMQNNVGVVFETPDEIAEILDALYEDSKNLTADYCRENMPVLAVRVVGSHALEDWGWRDPLDMNMFASDMEDVLDIPVYLCETNALEVLGDYIDPLNLGFMPEETLVMQVTTYSEDGTPTTIEYEAQDEIQEWLPKLMPSCMTPLVDPVAIPNDEQSADVTIVREDGTEINCVCYAMITEGA